MARVLSRWLAHEAPVEQPDGAGGWTRIWENRGGVWAEVRMRSGQLKATEFGDTPRLAVRIVTHAIPYGDPTAPAAGHRLTEIDGRRYVVDAVHETGPDRHLMTILAHEEAAT